MQTSNTRSKFLVLFIGATIIFSSCKKSKDSDNPEPDNFPVVVANIAPPTMIDSLRNIGAVINSGTTPPIVNGIYLMHPDSCTYDNSPNHFAGSLFTDYKFRFSAQNNTAFTIMVEQKDMATGNLSTTPSSTYITGSGNKFSIFLLRTSAPSGLAVQQFNILSGTLTAAGVQNLTNTLYVRSKASDPGNTFPAAGTMRIFVTGRTGLAASSASF